jgi:cell division protein ZapA (FtsZ GTPase activity inhibitor)
MAKSAVPVGTQERFLLGTYRGLEIETLITSYPKKADAITGIRIGTGVQPFAVSESNIGTMMSLSSLVTRLDQHLIDIRKQIEELQADKQSLSGLATAWELQEKYDALREQSRSLQEEIKAENAAEVDLKSVMASKDADDDIAHSQAILADALTELRALHADPDVLKRFGLSTAAAGDLVEPTPVPEVAELEARIEKAQAELAQLQFALVVADALPDETVQLDMFGGFTAPVVRRRRRRKKKAPTASQIAMAFGD